MHAPAKFLLSLKINTNMCIYMHNNWLIFSLQANFRNPLAKFHHVDSNIKKLNVKKKDDGYGYVFLHGKVYVLVGSQGGSSYILCISTADFKSKRVAEIKIPNLNTNYSALATFHSQLVLVGGNRPNFREVVNSVWVSSDGTDWQPSLPPMPTSRRSVTAVNAGGTPECLIVAGGIGNARQKLRTVEVLLEDQWFTVEPLPFPCCYSNTYTVPFSSECALHNGNLFFKTDRYDGHHFLVHCKLESLIAACKSTSESKTTLWKLLDLPHCVDAITSFGGFLMCWIERRLWYGSEAFAYSTINQSWFRVEFVDIIFDSLALPTGEIVKPYKNIMIDTFGCGISRPLLEGNPHTFRADYNSRSTNTHAQNDLSILHGSDKNG